VREYTIFGPAAAQILTLSHGFFLFFPGRGRSTFSAIGDGTIVHAYRGHRHVQPEEFDVQMAFTTVIRRRPACGVAELVPGLAGHSQRFSSVTIRFERDFTPRVGFS